MKKIRVLIFILSVQFVFSYVLNAQSDTFIYESVETRNSDGFNINDFGGYGLSFDLFDESVGNGFSFDSFGNNNDGSLSFGDFDLSNDVPLGNGLLLMCGFAMLGVIKTIRQREQDNK